MNTQLKQIQQYAFAENVPSPNIWVPDDRPIATHYFNLAGTITVSTAGTTNPLTNLYPILNNLFGLLTWQGRPLSNLGTGRQINGIPAFVFWWRAYLENSIIPVNSGTATTGALAAQTYTVNMTIPIHEFDPKWSENAQRAAVYRGARYNRPYWQWQGGLFAPSTLGNPDLQCYVNTATAPVYTTALTMTYSVDYVMDMGMNKNDPCMDMSFEYLPSLSFGANLSSVNNIALSLVEMQDYIIMLNTSLAASGIETGVNNLAVNNGGQMDTRFGGTTYDQFSTNAIQQQIQNRYLSGAQTAPAGLYQIDQISRSTQGTKKGKTFLGTSGTPYVDTWAGAIPGAASTQSLRLAHCSYNLSNTMKAALQPFGPFGSN